MKEIINFVEMMEKRINRYDAMSQVTTDNEYHEGGRAENYYIGKSPEYIALKSLANASVAKMEVTDDLIKIATKAHYKASIEHLRSQGELSSGYDGMETWTEQGRDQLHDIMRSALEAAFSSMPVSEEKDNDIFNSFPPELPILDEPEEKQGEWIEHDGKSQPIDDNVKVQIKFSDGRITQTYLAKTYEWNDEDGYPRIIAYRIISEPKEEKKQTFEEFAVRNTPNGNIDLLSPGELICLMSEWELSK